MVALATLPILLVLAMMLAGRSSLQAGPAGWLTALGIALAFYGADLELIYWSQVKGLMLSLWVLYIVWAALLFYRVVDAADGFSAVSAALTRLTADPLLQRLVLAWVFATFLQGVTGFGVPVAVVAPLLVGLGVSPLNAVVASSFGHAWAVTFGSVGSSMYAMAAVTGLEPSEIAPASAAMLGLLGIMSGVVVVLGSGAKSVLRSMPAILVIGAAMAWTQWVLAGTASWPLASFAAGCVGLLACALCSRLPWHQAGRRNAAGVRSGLGEGRARVLGMPRIGDAEAPALPEEDGGAGGGSSASAIVDGLLPYVFLTLLMVGFRILWPGALDLFVLRLAVPETRSALGWLNAAGATQGLSLLGHTGALIAFSAILAHLLGRGRGPRSGPGLPALFHASLADTRKPAISIVCLVGMSQVLGDAGMTDRIASAWATSAGAGFAFAVPAVGAIGSFVTGSNTNANVLFAALQAETAGRLGLSVPVILAGQNLGAALGSVLSPAKLVVAVSTVGVLGAESEALRRMIRPALLLLLFFGGLTWWFA